MISANTTFRVLIADDDALVRAAVSTILASDPAFIVAGEAENGEEVLERSRQLAPDLLLLDMNMPRKAGIETLRDLRGQSSPVKTLVLTIQADKRQIVETIQLGARGLVLKQNAGAVLLAAAHAVLQGRYWIDRKEHADIHQVLRELSIGTIAQQHPKRDSLNSRELKIVQLLVQGSTNKDIARQLGCSEQVVKNNLGRIFDKLGVFNRLELALYAIDNHIVQKP